MRHLILTLATATFLFTPLAAHAEGTIVLQKTIPYEKGTRIREAIRTDCDLEAKLATFLKDYAEENGFTVVAVDSFAKNEKRPMLEVVITDAVGGGGGAWSGAKSVFVEGKYKVDGKVKASFSAHRSSGGGFMGAYKGTCSILGRCVKALGRDMAVWLKNPDSGNKVGE